MVLLHLQNLHQYLYYHYNYHIHQIFFQLVLLFLLFHSSFYSFCYLHFFFVQIHLLEVYILFRFFTIFIKYFFSDNSLVNSLPVSSSSTKIFISFLFKVLALKNYLLLQKQFFRFSCFIYFWWYFCNTWFLEIYNS